MRRGLFLLGAIVAAGIFPVLLILKTGNYLGATLLGLYLLVMLLFSPTILGGFSGRD